MEEAFAVVGLLYSLLLNRLLVVQSFELLLVVDLIPVAVASAVVSLPLLPQAHRLTAITPAIHIIAIFFFIIITPILIYSNTLKKRYNNSFISQKTALEKGISLHFCIFNDKIQSDCSELIH